MIGFESDQQSVQNRRHLATCFGCSRPIKDEYSLHVADRQWHSQCLRCRECGKSLEEERTCFLQDNRLYCRHDLFRCPGCSLTFDLTDIVVHILPRTVYHSSCFRCIRCHRPLSSRRRHPLRASAPTDFALLPEGPLCREDFLEAVEERLKEAGGTSRAQPGSITPTSSYLSDDPSTTSDGDCPSSLTHLTIRPHTLPFPQQNPAAPSGTPPTPEEGAGDEEQGPRGARVRTVMNEAQLGVLRAFYGRNSRPDATMKDRLAAMTGLSTKVIRVWFQNKRCKEKKKTKTKA